MDFMDFMAQADKHHQQQDAEFARLRQNPPRNVKVKDKVLVAAGILGRGYVWIRKECEVIAISQSSVKVKCIEKHDEWEQWIDPALITDVIS